METAEYQPYPRGIESLETEEEKQGYEYIVGEIKEGRYVDIDHSYYLDIPT